jgi:acyl carrier protein
MNEIAKFKEELNTIFDKQEGQLSEDTRLREDLNAKSAHYFGIIASINELLGKNISYSKIKKCETIGEVLSLFKSLEA